MNDYKEYTQDILMVFKEVIEKYNLEVKVNKQHVNLISNNFVIEFGMEREGIEAWLSVNKEKSERFDFFCINRIPNIDFTGVITSNEETKKYGNFSGFRMDTITHLLMNKKLFFAFIEPFLLNFKNE
jgi:hypothetical protein